MLKLLKNHETLAVAFLTAILYVGSYFYERGSAIYYGIPPELITITPSAMISMVVTSFIFVVILFFVCNVVIKLMLRWTKSERLIKCAILSPVLLFWLAIGYLNNDLSYKGIASSFLIYFALCLAIIVLGSNKLDSNQDKNNQFTTNSIDSQASKTFSKKAYDFSGLIFWMGFIYLLSTHSLGKNSAEKQNSYDGFISNGENFAIVKIYGDAFIAKKIRDGKFSDGIYIFKTDDFKKISINKINLNHSSKSEM